ncbi:hypothetical protein ACFX2I_012604 [Malus domestica]
MCFWVCQASNVEERFKKIKDFGGLVRKKKVKEDDEWEMVRLRDRNMKISGWNFNEDEFGSDLVFPTESSCDSVVKMVRFGGETVIHPSSTSRAWEDKAKWLPIVAIWVSQVISTEELL